ncbi:MAG TPA: alpha-L-fucosidase [Paludibaculum sp.]|jgi:alpha-L-fucosidase
MRLISCFALLLICAFAQPSPKPSPKTVEEWQSRKFGLFIHWGLFSIAGGVWNGQPVRTGYSEQIQGEGRIPKEDYVKLAAQFNPEKWDPAAVARLAKEAGMKFVVLTSKHHDGFNMFGTKLTPYNVVDATPYKRDVVKELAEACRREGLRFGVYYSTIDWNYPGATPSDLGRNNNPIPKAHEDFNVGQLRELMSHYGPMTEIWFDMGEPTPEQSKRFADTVHAVQPECMVSGRVFNHQGDFTVMGDNRVPEYVIDEPWQTPASVCHETWGYRSWQKRDDLPGKTAEHILNLVKVVSRGGNYLLNIGPRGDGSIVEFEANVLKGMGAWLRVNGEAIYGAQAQPFRQLAFGHATVKPGKLFLFVRERPADGRLTLPGLNTKLTRAYFLADAARRPLEMQGEAILMPEAGPKSPPVTVVVAEYAGALDVMPPAVAPGGDGAVTLSAQAADKFYNYNGRGYYEKSTVYKLQWNFTAAPGRYRVMVEPAVADASVEIDGQPVADVAKLAKRGYHTLAITPKKPFVKGARLSALPGSVTVTPEK